MSITIKQCIAAAAAGFAIVAGIGAPAWAEPANIDDASGPRDAGAEVKDGSGTVGADFDTPTEIPSVGPAPKKPKADATEKEVAEYKTAVAEHERQIQARMQAKGTEHARLAAKAYRECIAHADENETC